MPLRLDSIVKSQDHFHLPVGLGLRDSDDHDENQTASNSNSYEDKNKDTHLNIPTVKLSLQHSCDKETGQNNLSNTYSLTNRHPIHAMTSKHQKKSPRSEQKEKANNLIHLDHLPQKNSSAPK